MMMPRNEIGKHRVSWLVGQGKVASQMQPGCVNKTVINNDAGWAVQGSCWTTCAAELLLLLLLQLLPPLPPPLLLLLLMMMMMVLP
jgi:hypothetical protein